jgi:hypothetical protein
MQRGGLGGLSRSFKPQCSPHRDHCGLKVGDSEKGLVHAEGVPTLFFLQIRPVDNLVLTEKCTLLMCISLTSNIIMCKQSFNRLNTFLAFDLTVNTR